MLIVAGRDIDLVEPRKAVLAVKDFGIRPARHDGYSHAWVLNTDATQTFLQQDRSDALTLKLRQDCQSVNIPGAGDLQREGDRSRSDVSSPSLFLTKVIDRMYKPQENAHLGDVLVAFGVGKIVFFWKIRNVERLVAGSCDDCGPVVLNGGCNTEQSGGRS